MQMARDVYKRQEQEDAFTKALEATTHYDMDGPMLLLLGDGELKAVFQAKP